MTVGTYPSFEGWPRPLATRSLCGNAAQPQRELRPSLALGAGLAAVPLAAMHFFSREKVQFGADVHFVGVGLTALPAAAAAVALTIKPS